VIRAPARSLRRSPRPGAPPDRPARSPRPIAPPGRPGRAPPLLGVLSGDIRTERHPITLPARNV
jgi:hypothetical protein